MNFPLRSWFLLPVLLALTGCKTTAEPDLTTPSSELRCHFDKAPFINPRIVQDLTTWISDTGDQVIGINIEAGQTSNRYFADTKSRTITGQNPFIYTETRTVELGETNIATFGYRLVGKTSSGIYVLETSDSGGGSGSFRSLMLVKLESDVGIKVEWEKGVVGLGKRRVVIKKLGEFALGDRWDAELRVVGDSIEVGGDRGMFAGTRQGGELSQAPKTRVLKVDLSK